MEKYLPIDLGSRSSNKVFPLLSLRSMLLPSAILDIAILVESLTTKDEKHTEY